MLELCLKYIKEYGNVKLIIHIIRLLGVMPSQKFPFVCNCLHTKTFPIITRNVYMNDYA